MPSRCVRPQLLSTPGENEDRPFARARSEGVVRKPVGASAHSTRDGAPKTTTPYAISAMAKATMPPTAPNASAV